MTHHHLMLNLPNLERNVPLAPLTTYQIGGPAEWFVTVHSAAELAAAVTEARRARVPFFVLGTGANIVVSDAGIKGLTIHNQADAARLVDNLLTAESGATIADLITLAAEQELSGLEHFAGIPSSVGGALWQNLHFLAPDRQSTLFIGDSLERATVLDFDSSDWSSRAMGERSRSSNGISPSWPSQERRNDQTQYRQVVDRDFFRFGYDDSILRHQPLVVLDATFALEPKPRREIEHQIAENLAWRRAKQPQLDEFPSCGSVFKKIEGVGAGRLISQAGLQGTTVGQIQVSPKHANYLVNLGGGTATDVRRLIELIQKTVQEQTGYELEPEIRFVGEW